MTLTAVYGTDLPVEYRPTLMNPPKSRTKRNVRVVSRRFTREGWVVSVYTAVPGPKLAWMEAGVHVVMAHVGRLGSSPFGLRTRRIFRIRIGRSRSAPR